MKGEELEQQALKSACEKECCLRALAALVPVPFVGVLLECFALEHCCWNASKEGYLTVVTAQEESKARQLLPAKILQKASLLRHAPSDMGL